MLAINFCPSILSFPRWVSHLITAKTKYTLAHQSVPDREEGNRPFLGWETGSVPLWDMGNPWGALGWGSWWGTGLLGTLPVIWGLWEKCSMSGGQG